MFTATGNLYRSAFKGLSPNTWKLSVVMLINRSGTMVIPFMTIYCTQQLHFTLSQAGIVMSLFGFGAIVGAYFGGKITDYFGFYPLQVSSLLLGGSMFMIIGFLKTFPILCIGTFVLSVCNESFRPANATAIAHYSTPENRTRSYSLNRLAINLGWSVGGAMGGFLASVNYSLLFWVDGCTNILAALLLLRLLPYTKGGNKYKAPHEKVAPRKSIFTDSAYLVFIICTILFAAVFFQGFTMQPVFFKTEWHFNEQFIGILLALNGIIIVVIEMVLIYKLERLQKHTLFIQLGFVLTGIGFIIVNFFSANVMVALLSVTIYTFGEIFAMPFMNTYWVSRSNDSNRGQYAAMYAIAWSIAQIIAPLAGSHIAAEYGFSFLWNMDLLVCFIAASGIWANKKREQFSIN